MSNKPRFSPTIKKQTMAEQVAEAIKEAILADEWQSGEALPTEPELSSQFGVSRAVIRDATRMLAAQGLVEAQHGKGVFVTSSQVEAFGDALLLALRRAGATVWDVEHFEQVIYPEVCALASQEATDEELTAIRAEIEHYI
jgi:DNA-binding FadR family transcriptional regulator